MQLVPLLFRRQHAPIAHVQQKPCRVRTTSATVATEVELASAILPTLMVSARSSTRSSRACKRADRGCWADEKAGAEPVVPGAAAACLLLSVIAPRRSIDVIPPTAGDAMRTLRANVPLGK